MLLTGPTRPISLYALKYLYISNTDFLADDGHNNKPSLTILFTNLLIAFKLSEFKCILEKSNSYKLSESECFL